jgi:hypothetical protein
LGAEAGTYEVQLRDDAVSARTASTGEAEIRESVTTLHVTLDTADLSAGAYQLEIRLAGGEWLRVPARLK